MAVASKNGDMSLKQFAVTRPLNLKLDGRLFTDCAGFMVLSFGIQVRLVSKNTTLLRSVQMLYPSNVALKQRWVNWFICRMFCLLIISLKRTIFSLYNHGLNGVMWEYFICVFVVTNTLTLNCTIRYVFCALYSEPNN